MSLFPSSTERRVEYEEGNILSDWRRGRCAAVLLAVPLGNAYIGNYLSVYGGMDTQSYVLLMQSAVTGFQILGGVLLGLFRRGVSFPAQTVSNDFILECPGVQLYAGAFLIVLFGEFPSMCSVRISFHLLTNGSDSYTIALLYNAAIRRLPQWKRTLPPHWKGSRRRP